jgi:hypothetical protein
MSFSIHLSHLKYATVRSVPDSSIESSIALPSGSEAIVKVRIALPIEVKYRRGASDIIINLHMEGQTVVGKMGQRSSSGS